MPFCRFQREFRKNVRFARAFGTQFHEIVVVFTKRNEPRELYQFLAKGKMFGVETNRLHQQIQPFVFGEILPRLFEPLSSKSAQRHCL